MTTETWGTLRDDGASAHYVAGELRLRATDAVRERVRAAVEARRETMRQPPKLPAERGHCDACGGELEGQQAGGWCPLCTMARRLVLR